MVTHDVVAHGVDLHGTANPAPALLQVNTEDFPGRFLHDLATQGVTPPAAAAISSTTVVDPSAQPLYQPVQRIFHLALAQLWCNSPGAPRLDPLRVVSAGIVIRRVSRVGDVDQLETLQAWMRSPAGQFGWTTLDATNECLDPDPTKRAQLFSGRPELDVQLAAIALAAASTETTSPVFLAPPATCTTVGRTIAYGVIPTASSDTSDAAPGNAPTYSATDVADNLPALLTAGPSVRLASATLGGIQIDYRWMTDEFLDARFPPVSPPPAVPPPATGATDASAAAIAEFRAFSTALRMLKTVFGAFDATPEGRRIRDVLNGFKVYTSGDLTQSAAMGDFYADAAAKLLDYSPADGSPGQVTLPYGYDPLGSAEPTPLAQTLLAALGPPSRRMLLPQGRYQDATRLYRLRMFFRVKSDHANCPPELIWTANSQPFRIAPWYESGARAHPPVPLPDPTDRNFLKKLTPNCSFVVPRGLMSAMQGSSLSGLMNGTGGGPALTLDWICGFNIPLITICAFFVLNIFLGLLNIVFFWLPMIKICIPLPIPLPKEE